MKPKEYNDDEWCIYLARGGFMSFKNEREAKSWWNAHKQTMPGPCFFTKRSDNLKILCMMEQNGDIKYD